MKKYFIKAHMLLLASWPSTATCQLFNGLFADIDVKTARQLGFSFDGPGISFNKPVDVDRWDGDASHYSMLPEQQSI